ncbi:MAG: glycosyltransferase family protein [Bacteroidota bacterium]|nr:glycosyltransferase family protein [Bacteroidota bacterium]
MISIIICHRNITSLEAIKESIKETIGVKYELIIIDNSQNKYSICSAYNEGVRRAKYDVMCFTHEDILFHTNNWGEKVIAHFADPQVGMIGVAGGMSQSGIPSAWWFNNYFAKSARNLLMKSPAKKQEKLYQYYSNPFNDSNKTEVIIVDGLWFCVRKSLFNQISFDEKTFSGFHLYDADISMQANQHAKNYVVFNIFIEHLWSGSISKEYYSDLLAFTNKWSGQLPIQTGQVEADYMDKYNFHALRALILEMKTKNYSNKFISELIQKYQHIISKGAYAKWYLWYFYLSRKIGYANANRLFYRLEKLGGFCRAKNHTTKMFFEQNVV